MAGMFYSLQEVMEKLEKSEQEIKDLIKQGKLREFRDGAKLLFKINEVDAIVSEPAQGSAGVESSDIDMVLDETGEISLEPDEEDIENELKDVLDTAGAELTGGFGLSHLGNLTGADTSVGTTGINVLAETDDEYELADDTKAETRVDDSEDSGLLGDLDSDSAIETVGSGSGLLDLSLQADDTSLGAVLDDILPSAAEGEAQDDADQEADQIFEQAASVGGGMPSIEEVAVMPASRYVEVPPDSVSNAYGIVLFVPLAAVIYAVIILVATVKGINPNILNRIANAEMGGLGIIWYVVAGLAMMVFAVIGFTTLAGGSGKKSKKVDVYQQPIGK